MLFFSDDPYYCGLRARIPNFAKSKVQKEKESSRMAQQQQQQQPPASTVQAVERAALRPTQVHGHPMAAWHHGGGGQHGGGNGAPTRGYLDNGTREKRKARECAGHCGRGMS